MGCDIHTRTEKRDGDRWISLGYQPFDWRCYGMYAFLAGVRNYSGVTPIAEPRGLPPDTSYVETDEDWLGEHSFSWLSLDELLAFDYDQEMEDRRVMRQTGHNSWDGGCTSSDRLCAP